MNLPPPELSVVVPVHNEAENIAPLVAEIRAAFEGRLRYEIIYVDDGSTDDSAARLRAIAAELPLLRLLRHRESCGQSTAILTGAQAARAAWIATLDGDGQNDPADILKLWAILEHNPSLQLIAGKREKRQDNWLKRFSSRIANSARSWFLNDQTLDTGCGLKLFAKDAYLRLPYFDHNHRFLPALFLRHGGKIVSVAVNHRPRQQGKSKYGLHNRLWVGIIDLFGVKWLQGRARLPVMIEDVKNDK